MTREELDSILATLPGVTSRWGVARDLPQILAIEAATLGGWDEQQFRAVLKRRDCIIRVVECAQTRKVRGFSVYRIDDVANCMFVMNLAAFDPVARRGMIEAVQERSRKSGRKLLWIPVSY